jgi:hypothetical protein
MAEIDSFQANILGVSDLIQSGINKTNEGDGLEEGLQGEEIDYLKLPMSDQELLELKESYESKHNGYYPKIKPRQDKNKLYYSGRQRNNSGDVDRIVPKNLLFQSEETFIPQALSQNPEPVVWSDNTPEGKAASNDLKTMLQYHADIMCLRRKLGVMVRHWSIYFVGALKYGWDKKTKDIKLEIRHPQNFVFDPDGYVDEYGNFIGEFLGERIETTAEKLIDLFPEHKDYILIKVSGKKGTRVIYTKWWNDDYCFSTYQDVVLDKHKNEYWNYEDEDLNHFATPKMPYTLLSVFSLQERPHDITSLIEQNIPNQDRINDRDDQISKNLASANNAVVLSGKSFTVETGTQARDSLFDEGFILIPDGNMDAVKRIPASDIPAGVFTAQESDIQNLQGVFGTQGLAPQPNQPPETARGMILDQSHDSSRIGGGIGDALEQVADNVFNWLTQLYSVWYDEPHYAAIMGNGRAVEYVSLIQSDFKRKFVVSVSPNSMAPKDEVSEMNQAVELFNAHALDPISLFKKLNYPDPMETAKQVSLWVTNPQLYMQTYFPQQASPQSPGSPGQGQVPPQPGSPPTTLSQEPANTSLSNVPLNSPPGP